MQEITIVGAGLSGLIAAIQIAEEGGRVVLHEAGAKPGGRARTDSSIHRVNLAPEGCFEPCTWLWQFRQLLPRMF